MGFRGVVDRERVNDGLQALLCSRAAARRPFFLATIEFDNPTARDGPQPASKTGVRLAVVKSVQSSKRRQKHFLSDIWDRIRWNLRNPAPTIDQRAVKLYQIVPCVRQSSSQPLCQTESAGTVGIIFQNRVTHQSLIISRKWNLFISAIVSPINVLINLTAPAAGRIH